MFSVSFHFFRGISISKSKKIFGSFGLFESYTQTNTHSNTYIYHITFIFGNYLGFMVLLKCHLLWYWMYITTTAKLQHLQTKQTLFIVDITNHITQQYDTNFIDHPGHGNTQQMGCFANSGSVVKNKCKNNHSLHAHTHTHNRPIQVWNIFLAPFHNNKHNADENSRTTTADGSDRVASNKSNSTFYVSV